MKKIYVLLFALLNIFPFEEVTIRIPLKSEFKKILKLDRKVTFEFFKPILINGYPHLDIGKNADYYLEKDLEEDSDNFSKYFKNNLENMHLRIAFDNANKKIIGLLHFHIIKKIATIDLNLLVVDKNHRGKGIGKRLIFETIANFKKSLKYCTAYIYRYSNDQTLKFYKKLGFKNLGLANDELDSTYLIENSKIFYKLMLRI